MLQEFITNIQQFLLHPYFQQEYWGNTGLKYVITFGIFVGLTLVFKIFQTIVLRRLSLLADHTKSDIDDEIIKIIKSVRPRFYSFLAFYLAVQYLAINDFFSKIINVILIVWFTYQVLDALQILIDYIARKQSAEEDNQFKTAISVASLFAKITLWTIALLLVLSNLGINITSLIAGLGIGGIAVAMAVKDILSDLLASFSIYFDKPFLVGDYIAMGETKGTVEKIGIKTTRIRAPQGEQIVVSNNDLTANKIQNFKKLEERRVVFNIGVTYDTPTGKLKQIPEMIKQIINPINDALFDRVYFTTFGDSALIFEIVYNVETPEYEDYLKINQEINLKIKENFEKEGIEMAYPTQTVFVKNQK